MVEHEVRFFPGGQSVRVEDGASIWEAAIRLGIRIDGPCGGQGRCGRCQVICPGHEGEEGRESIDAADWEAGVRLACQSLVHSDLEVLIPSPDAGDVQAISSHAELGAYDLDPLGSGGLGLVADIGTTTVAVSILDLASGEELASASDYNRQIVLGEDVLSRMEYSEDSGPERLRELVLETINDLVDACDPGYGKQISAAVISANTVMAHLFLGVDPSPMRYESLTPLVRDAKISGAESGLNILPEAEVLVMPSVAAYVGGDVTSDIVHSGMDRAEGLSLLIDVGTNGEVVLGNSDFLISASSSAGPSFEGGDICCGMRACGGAVETVELKDGKFSLGVIGGLEPRGICGSGLIDLLAALSREEWVDRRGRFTELADAEDYEDTRRLQITEGIFISEDDIQSLIRTKGAIYSACRSLLLNLGMDFGDLEKVYICGGFGKHLDLEASIRIGLLPDLPRDRFEYLGNSSLAGAKMTLLSGRIRERVEDLMAKLTYLDLSSDVRFFDEYSSALFLPHTDLSLFPSL